MIDNSVGIIQTLQDYKGSHDDEYEIVTLRENIFESNVKASQEEGHHQFSRKNL